MRLIKSVRGYGLCGAKVAPHFDRSLDGTHSVASILFVDGHACIRGRMKLFTGGFAMNRALLGSVVVVMVATAQAQGASVHLKSGPSITTSPTSLRFCVALAGLGNQDIQATITATGEATVTCLNPSGFLVPGKNKVPITATATTTIKSNQIKNGNVSFCVTATAPATVDPLLAGCPNANWTAKVVSVDFTSVTLVVVQGGKVVLNQTFTVKASAQAAYAIVPRKVLTRR